MPCFHRGRGVIPSALVLFGALACSGEPPAEASEAVGIAGAGGGASESGTQGGAGAGGARAARGCATPLWNAGESHEMDVQHGGETRTYLVHVGSGVDVTAATPLTLNFHGLGSNAGRQESYSRMSDTADARGLIVAYPQGKGHSFNAGPCCSNVSKPPHQADDLGFARAIVADVAEHVCVDERRVYSTGMSNGGYMSEHLACHASDIFAAVAPVSAMAVEQPDCVPDRAVPLIAFNGTGDRFAPYDQAAASTQGWVARNGCAPEPQRTHYGEAYCDTWSDCRDGAEVVLCTLPGMEHCWPGSPRVHPLFCKNGGGSEVVAALVARKWVVSIRGRRGPASHPVDWFSPQKPTERKPDVAYGERSAGVAAAGAEIAGNP